MKLYLGMIGLVGFSSLAGCSAEAGSGVGDEAVSAQSEAVLVTSAALSRGTRRDYDGDGKEDVLFFDNDHGTYETLGQSPGGFAINAATLVRADLYPGNTRYAAGDFNHDNKTDLLVTTSAGTSLWTGKAGGGFNSNVWSTTVFKLTSGPEANFDITLGDFNGDGFTDFIGTTANGSYLYTGKGTGGANGGFNANVWTNTSTAFKRYNGTLTAGNFNSDATTDLIVTTSTGSVLYTGNVGTGASGGFTLTGWSNSSLTNSGNNVSRFFVGNFNGVGADDFIVQKFTGTYLYVSGSGPTFTQHTWSDPATQISGSPLTVGDYNGDGCSDFLYQDGNGVLIRTYRQGTPSVPGTFNAAVRVDTRFGTFYDFSIKRGDFTGDGKDDFVIQSRPNTGNGSYEFTGTSAATGGFNADVWTDSGWFQGSAW